MTDKSTSGQFLPASQRCDRRRLAPARQPRNTLVRVPAQARLPGAGLSGESQPRRDRRPEGLQVRRASCPKSPDVALVITPAQTVPGDHRGVRRARASATRSCSAPASRRSKAARSMPGALAEAAREHDVAVIGPNCQGVWSVRQRSHADLQLGADEHRQGASTRPIAVVSQSGALAGAIGNALQGSGMGCSYIVSVGNETCLDALDAAELGHRTGRCSCRRPVHRRASTTRAGSCASRSARASAACRSSC